MAGTALGAENTWKESIIFISDAHEKCQTVSDKLTWSHICELIKIDDELERSFYEKECYKKVERKNAQTADGFSIIS